MATRSTSRPSTIPQYEHQFLAVKTDADRVTLPIDANGEVVTREVLQADVESILPRRKAVTEIEPIQPGTYLLFDNFPRHFASGEYAVIHVSAP